MKNRIGIVGGGQLGKMMAIPAKSMGFTVNIIDPTPNSPAGQVVDSQITAGYNDSVATRKLAKISDFITVEIEHINTETLSELAEQGIPVNPSPKTIEIIKNKFAQKEFLTKSGIPVAPYAAVENKRDILTMAKKFGYPFLLKARFDAYDGRGNALVKKPEDIDKILERFGKRELYVEQYVPFVKELAVMIARSMKGDIVPYPVVETIHENNILHLTIAPARVDKKIFDKAKNLAIKTMEHLYGAGVFGIEMFLTKDGDVLINEIAPRVHNSGHYTTEACVTSQFEQHIRAITGLPLGNPEMLVPAAVMINILGQRLGLVDIQGMDKVLAIPNTTVHIYGKTETKPERKMGHITVIGDKIEDVIKNAEKARKLLTI
jgi:5-(carboxyamino)imidazole ribonucleotide synthase